MVHFLPAGYLHIRSYFRDGDSHEPGHCIHRRTWRSHGRGYTGDHHQRGQDIAQKRSNTNFTGQIVNDEALQQRAARLGVSLTIRDDKRKVTQRDGILVGEVSETEAGVTRKRRLYATAGEFALAEITSDDIRLTRKGKASTFVVLGNQITQQIAHSCIREHGKNMQPCTMRLR